MPQKSAPSPGHDHGHAGDAPARKLPASRAFLVGIGVCMALAAAHVAWWVSQGVGPVDDDYIVYRYGRQWLSTGTLAFNSVGPGSAPWSSEGFTSPLWLALCVLAESLGIRPGVWTPGVGVTSSVLATCFVGLAARRVISRAATFWGLLAAAWVALSPSFAWHAVSGLGTAPMGAALAVGIWAAAASRPLVFGASMAVAVGFRMEALVVAIPLGLAQAWRGESAASPWRTRALWLAPALATGALIVLARWHWYHRLFPATYFAKRLPLAEELRYGARYLMRATAEGGLPILGLVAVMGLGERQVGTTVRALGAASVAALLFVLSCGGDWMVYGRFLVPFTPVFAVAGVAVVASFKLRAIRALALMALFAGPAVGLRPEVRDQAIFEHQFFERWWLRVGDELSLRAPENASVAVSPIGAIGWRSGLTIVDILGLTHDEFLGVGPDLEGVGVKGHHRHDGGWVLDQEPTYLLLGNAVVQPGSGSVDINPWERDILADPRFRRDYTQDTVWVNEPDGSRRPLPYFRRVGAPRLGPRAK